MNGKKLLVATSLSLALGGAGCGVDENVYNAAVKDRDAKAAALAQTQADLDKEKLAHKKDADRATNLSKKLEALGQDVSRLETERTGLGGELDEAKKRMEELKKAQAQAEARSSASSSRSSRRSPTRASSRSRSARTG
jgi:septal ring factor EnvC (AmiA/AmiB activator)